MEEIHCSGMLLASLMRAAGDGPVEGLLQGQVQEFETSEIADAHESKTKVQRCCMLLRHIVTGHRLSFYDADGRVDESVVAEAEQTMPVVGWFIVRRGMPAVGVRPSVRDAAVHQSLCSPSSNGGAHALRRRVLVIMSCGNSSVSCTSSIDILCLHQPQPGSLRFAPVPLRMKNLVHDAMSEYRSFRSLAGATMGSPERNSLQNCLPRLDSFPPNHVHEFEAAFDRMMHNLDEQMQQLRQVEVEVQRLEAENATLEGETMGSGKTSTY